MRLQGLVFVSICFPFASLFPINTDVQPLFLVFILSDLLVRIKNSKIRALELLLIVLGLLSLIYVNIFSNSSFISFKGLGAHVSFFVAIISFLYFRRLDLSRFSHLFKLVIRIYLALLVGYLVAPELSMKFQENFVRAVNVNSADPFGYRGYAIMATEPGLFAGLMVVFLLINDYYFNSGNYSVRDFRLNFIFIVLLIVCSKSGTGYLYFLIYLVFRLKFLGFALISCVIAFIQMKSYTSNRGFDAMLQLLDYNNLPVNSGIYKRILDVRVGFESLFSNPIGLGLNNAQFIHEYVSIPNVKLFVIDNVYGFNSSLSFWIVSYGFVFLGLAFLLILLLSRFSAVSLFFAMLFLSISYSAAFPPIWLLLTLKTEYNVRRNRCIE